MVVRNFPYVLAFAALCISPAAVADDMIYPLDSTFQFSLGFRYGERVKIERSIHDTHLPPTRAKPPTAHHASLTITYDVEVIKLAPDKSVVGAIYTVKSAVATINEKPAWAPRVSTRMEVRRNEDGPQIKEMPNYLEPAIADLVKLSFISVRDPSETETDAYANMPDAARIGERWPVDLEAFRRSQQGHRISYERAAIEGDASLVGRAALGDTEVLVIESEIRATGVTEDLGVGMPDVGGRATIKTQLVSPVDVAAPIGRLRIETTFDLGAGLGNGRAIERHATGTLQVDYDYPETQAD